VPTADGLELVLHHWTGPGVRAALHYVHGIQSHAGWLRETGPELVRRGVEVFVLDRRGSGRSPGPRGHAPSAEVLIDDQVRALAETARRRSCEQVAALGQSFGGSLLAAVLVAQPAHLDPVVFCAPALGQQRARAGGDPERLAALRALRGTAPAPLSLADRDYTDDPAELARMGADPLVVREVTAGMRAAMVGLEDVYTAAASLPVPHPPLLAVPRRDPVIDLDAARRVLAEKAPGTVERRFVTDRHYLEFSADRVAYWDWLAAAVLGPRGGGR
jgi:alpha-beta hydrolase superfamily lysophospholipase